MREDGFNRVQIGRDRVNSGMAAVGMGLLATALALDVLFIIAGGIGFYDAAFWLMAAGALALLGSVVPGLVSWLDDARDQSRYVSRADDGNLVATTIALMITIVGLTFRMNYGAAVGGELAFAFMLALAGIATLTFTAPLSVYLVNRFGSRRSDLRVTMSPEARTRETIER